MTEDNRSLLDQLREMLWRDWDPIGVNGISSCTDEYDSYVPGLADLVQNGSSPSEIVDYLWTVETECMGLRGDRPATEAFALRLTRLRE